MGKRNIFFKKLAGIFIANKELGILSILFIVFFGILGFVLMAKQYNPEIVAPAFRITTVFPHATAEEVYELVTRPMENKVREIALVDDMYSQSSVGVSVVTVTFDIGSNEQDAKVDLVQRLRSNMGEKPLGAFDPMIEEIDVDDVPIVTLALTSDQFSQEALRSFGLDLSDRLKYVPHVGKITVRGGLRSDVSVFVDIDKLNNFGVSISDVHKAISANNENVLTVQTDSDPYKIPVRVYGNISHVNDLAKIVIAKTAHGVVRVEDIARVEVSEMAMDHHVQYSDKNGVFDTVLIGIAKQNGSNATTVATQIHEEIATLKEQGFIPTHTQVIVVGDDGIVARKSIGGLTTNLVQSIIIVVIVLLLFLSTRSAFVVAVAIPLSLLSVFGLGMLFGQTINRITLFALILSLGLLVDNATVVVENMYRLLKLRKEESKEDVITDAVSEVGGGLVMSTITTVLAFIPMAFVTGMMGPYMSPIPFFVPGAIIASLFIALTINPFIGNMILGKSEKSIGAIAFMQRRVQKGVRHLENFYVRFISDVFAHRKKENIIIFSVVFLVAVSIALPFFTAVKFRMLPKADRDQFYIYVDALSDAHIEHTNAVALEIVQTVQAVEHVINTQMTVGTAPVADFNGLFRGSDGRISDAHATIRINLSESNERSTTSEDIATHVRKILAPIAIKENVNIKIVEDPPGPPVLSTYQLKVQGHNRADYDVLREMANDLLKKSHQIEGVVDLDTSSNENGIEKTYRINTEEATRLGVSVQNIFMTMETMLHGTNVGLLHDTVDNDQKFMEQHYISLRSEMQDRHKLSDIDRVTVRSENGSLVALSALLTEVEMPIDDVILMDAQYPTVYVNGEMQDRSVVYASIDMLHYLVTAYKLPSGHGVVDSWNLFGVRYIDADGTVYSVRIGGEWELTLEVFRDFGIAFGVAIFLIYFVLVAQFRSLKIPLYIMATIPLALIGVLPGFMILYIFKGTYFNATSMIGVIALAGIVVNNAIIYLEYVFQEINRGASMERALIESGRTRLLPIGLTSLTTILGSLTIISDPVWEGLAWSIITGMSLSAVLTLVVLPILYRRYES